MGFSINNLLNEATLSQQKKADIKKIHYSKLIPSANNYFSMKDIEMLADDIEDNGLLQNLVVKENTDINTYTIVVGHRRHAAVSLLVENRGLKKFEEINCLIISQDEDVLLTEYKLITSNLTHRGGFTALEPKDKLKTVERLTEIFRDFKQRGHIAKGSLKNLVAEALDISPMQAQKYQSVADKADEELLEKITSQKVSLNDAYSVLSDKNGKPSLPKQSDFYLAKIQKSLQSKLNASVKIDEKKIVIKYIDIQDIVKRLGLEIW